MRDDERKRTTCGHPLCFELVLTRTHRLVLNIYIYSTSIYTAITNDSPIANCRSFPIFDFRVSPRKLRALLNTQTNLMEATITLDHGKHLTKPKKRTKELGRVQWDLCQHIHISIYVSGYESDWIPFKYATE